MSLSPSTQFGFPPPSHPSPLNLRQTTLSLPITERRGQLISAGGPIERLQRRAQSAVAQFYGIVGGSSALAVFVSQTPIGEATFDLTTALGVCLLGSVTAAWRLQGKWKKAKSYFWDDWKRAQQGMSYDLQVSSGKLCDFITLLTKVRLTSTSCIDRRMPIKCLIQKFSSRRTQLDIFYVNN